MTRYAFVCGAVSLFIQGAALLAPSAVNSQTANLSPRTEALQPSTGPSLSETMAFIGKETLAQSPLYYRHDEYKPNGDSMGNVFGRELDHISSTKCVLTGNLTMSFGGHREPPVTWVIDFSEAASVRLEDSISGATRDVSDSGHPDYRVIDKPNYFDISIINKDGGRNLMMYKDHSVAERVAKAMAHAITLCGGGTKDPF